MTFAPEAVASELRAALALATRWPATAVALAVVDQSGPLMTLGDWERSFPLASVTKPLFAYAVLIAVEEGSLGLDEPMTASPLPAQVTVRQLLSHASGLPFEGSAPLVSPVSRRIYSNAGFDLLAQLLERTTSMTASEYVTAALFEPLGMLRTHIDGSVAKDGFSTVEDLTRFAAELLCPTLLADTTYRDFITAQQPELAGVVPGFGHQISCPWGLGVEIRGNKTPHWTGTGNSPGAFGHFGAAGTFFLVEPSGGQAPYATICLTNEPFGLWAKKAWPELNDAIILAMGNGNPPELFAAMGS